MWTKRWDLGRFGMAEETGRILNEVIRSAQSRQEGLGQAVGAYLSAANARWADRSLIATAHRLQIPVTVHVAIGTDIIHMHEDASGAAIGDASLRDFRYFTSCVARLSGGVYLNCGSAVILPEVFLKAVALARNQGIALDGLTTVNIDFMRMYRPQTNVVTRPVAGNKGQGISLVGHHEVLIPLIAAAVRPASTAFLASRPAASGALGFEVLVHEVIAAMSTSRFLTFTPLLVV